MRGNSLAIVNYDNFKKDGSIHRHNFVNTYVEEGEL